MAWVPKRTNPCLHNTDIQMSNRAQVRDSEEFLPWALTSVMSLTFGTSLVYLLQMLRLLLCKLELRSWHAVYNCSECPLVKVDHHKGGGISDFREQCFGFFFCSWCALLEKQPSVESWWTHFTLWVGEPLPKQAAWPPTRKGSLQNGQELQLSCINTSVLEKGLQSLWCHHLSLLETWGYEVIPCSALLSLGVSTPVPHGGQTCREVF